MTHAVESSNGGPHGEGTLVLTRPGYPQRPSMGVTLPQLVGRVLASVAGRLADSVDGIPVGAQRARGVVVAPSGAGDGTSWAVGPTFRVALDVVVRLLEWVRQQVAHLIALASRLFGRDGGADDPETVPEIDDDRRGDGDSMR